MNHEIPYIFPFPASAYKLAGNSLKYVIEPKILVEGDGYIKGARIIHSLPLNEAQARSVASILSDNSNYGDLGMGARCFFPGFAFTFGIESNMVTVQVCLECNWVVFYTSNDSRWLVPNEIGIKSLKEIYGELLA